MEVLEQMKKTFRARTAKAISAVLVAAFTFTLIPMALGQNAVVAATAITKDQSNTRLGVSDIAGPSAPNNGWNGSYVYFGHNGTGGNEIKFRVLDPNSDKYGGNTLFLDSDETLLNIFEEVKDKDMQLFLVSFVEVNIDIDILEKKDLSLLHTFRDNNLEPLAECLNAFVSRLTESGIKHQLPTFTSQNLPTIELPV